MTRMKRMIFILIIICLLICGCVDQQSDSVDTIVDENQCKLVVYMNSTPHTFRKVDSEGNVVDTVIYPSRYTTGTMLSAGDVDSPNSNIFQGVLEKYEKDTGIEIEIRYLEEEYDGKSDLLQKIVDSDGKLPDMLLLNKQPQYDYYRLSEQGMLLDFSTYVENDLEIGDNELYYQEVVSGGKIKGQQFALPVLFSMNAMMSTSGFIREIGCLNPEYGSTFEDILYILEESCLEMEGTNTVEAIYETSGSMPVGHYIPSILTGAAYPSYFNVSTGELIVSEYIIEDIMELMVLFNRQEFSKIIGWEENSYIGNIRDERCKSYSIPHTAEANEYIGVFLSGGRSGGVGFFSSLLTDVAFMQTVYKDANEEMVLCGIPTLESEREFSANISLAAYGLATTEYPEEVYKLARYLMDYQFPYQYGFSVNKNVTNKQIENAQKTTLSVYPEDIWDGVNSVMDKEDLQSLIYHTDPLSAENAAIIQNMLDNIAGAGLPYAVLEYNMYNSMLNMVGDGKMTPSEAGKWVMTQWNQYLNQLGNWEPFYDLNFNNSIQLYGDLPEEE